VSFHVPVQLGGGVKLSATGGAKKSNLVDRLTLIVILLSHHQVFRLHKELALVKQVGLLEQSGLIALALLGLKMD
jgi:hypothetical protein